MIASIGSHEYVASQFARDVAFATDADAKTHQYGGSQTLIRKAVVDAWIRRTALLSRAESEGVTVSDAQLDAFLRQQELMMSKAGPAGQAAAESTFEFDHDNGSTAYFGDPKVRDAYRRGLMIVNLDAKHLGPSPSAEAQIAFEAETIKLARAKVNLPL